MTKKIKLTMALAMGFSTIAVVVPATLVATQNVSKNSKVSYLTEEQAKALAESAVSKSKSTDEIIENLKSSGIELNKKHVEAIHKMTISDIVTLCLYIAEAISSFM